jgi:hypothetical protein
MKPRWRKPSTFTADARATAPCSAIALTQAGTDAQLASLRGGRPAWRCQPPYYSCVNSALVHIWSAAASTAVALRGLDVLAVSP